MSAVFWPGFCCFRCSIPSRRISGSSPIPITSKGQCDPRFGALPRGVFGPNLTFQAECQGGTCMTVSRILAVKGRAVVTVEPEQTIQAVAHILSSKGIGAAVVSSGAGDV